LAEEKEKGKTPEKAPEKEKGPELVDLKEIAKKVGVEPRQARAILRSLAMRGEEKKRARWAFPPAEVAGVVTKIKGALDAKAKAKAEKDKEA